MENTLHVDSWTDCNLWCHSQTANYRIVKCSGKWRLTMEVKPGRQWDFMSGIEYDNASEALQAMELIAK